MCPVYLCMGRDTVDDNMSNAVYSVGVSMKTRSGESVGLLARIPAGRRRCLHRACCCAGQKTARLSGALFSAQAAKHSYRCRGRQPRGVSMESSQWARLRNSNHICSAQFIASQLVIHHFILHSAIAGVCGCYSPLGRLLDRRKGKLRPRQEGGRTRSSP